MASRISITIATSEHDIASTFKVLSQLRPDLEESRFVATIRALHRTEGFCLAALREDEIVRAVAGFRTITMLYRGRILVIDDLVTDVGYRSRGFGAQMLSFLRSEAHRRACVEIQLISRLTREDAHRFYKNHGFRVECMHFVSDA